MIPSERLRDLAARAGTPLLVVSEERLRANVRELFAGLGMHATLRYCAKTNPELRILEIVREEGADVLTSHEAEVRLALAAGYSAERIAFQKPVLDERELDAILALGVRRVHAFRAADLDLLARAAKRNGVTLRVSLRIALGSGMFVLSAASRRLGFDAAQVDVTPRDGLIVDALNTYIGTQQENVEAYRPALRALVRLAARIGTRIGTIAEINLGGGVPSHTLRRVSPARLLRRGAVAPGPALVDYAKSLRALFDEETTAPMRLALEPGRSIVGNAAVLLTRVAATQGRWHFLDCGRNVLVESPLAFTRAIQPLEPRRGRTSVVHFSGPTLNTLDVVEMRRRMPELAVGDVLAISDAGAYTLSRGTSYAGLAPAVVLAHGDGTFDTIRRAETYDDFAGAMVRR
jgi:diaminopimelate decarboxylase